ncbi:hypothetical protein DFP72DRAFT_849486 [Ephemerocybe angulata]|uniref:Translocation protein sec72 n=1 Tax=Ephemerocybe angulata TaxID=980116 RepID=A0A8H6M6G7_9AGAR|nr:hypothetical protein DFP72DRAFT_849486 [Tulosesus angulatus]
MTDHEHSHTHAPGEEHTHSHDHGPHSPIDPPTDPASQALIDQDFVPVALAVSPDGHNALCAEHKLEKCDSCNVDFINTNRLARLLASNPSLLCPPPNNVVSQQLSQMVQRTKDEGNALFKQGQAVPALARYTQAASYAVQRPPWEANQVMREEVTTCHAETVISLRRSWPKGHFRKAKALLGMHKTKEAAESVRLGLSFEPQNNELLTFLHDIEKVHEKLEEKKQQKLEGAVPVTASA